MQPNGICVPSNELVNIHTVDGRLPLDSLLLPLDENGHVLFLPALLFFLFNGSEFTTPLCHDRCCSFIAIALSHTFRPVRPQHNDVFNQTSCNQLMRMFQYVFSILKPAILATSFLYPPLMIMQVEYCWKNWDWWNWTIVNMKLCQIRGYLKPKLKRFQKMKNQYAVPGHFGAAL